MDKPGGNTRFFCLTNTISSGSFPGNSPLGNLMVFNVQTQELIEQYVRSHIADDDFHINYFDFIDDVYLAKRLGEEFVSTRYIYKMLEGIEAKEWLQRAQVRFQVISYASIYEASLHHILFTNLRSDPRVVALTERSAKIKFSIPSHKMDQLKECLEHDGKEIIPTYQGLRKTDETQVRFDKKAECACEIGIIESWLRDDLIEFYEARNAIHIHAEIRKNLDYQLELSKKSYRRMMPFKEQILKWQRQNG